MNKIVTIIPCFNEEQTLLHLNNRLTNVLENVLNYKYQVIYIDDGSTDKTWNKIQQLVKNNKNIQGIKLSRNFGHQNAIQAGLENASGDLIFIIDADLQDPPELLPKMIKKIEQGYDVVYGKRILRKGESKFKKISAYLYYRILNLLSDHKIPTDSGDFRLINKKALNAFLKFSENEKYIRGLFSFIGFKQTFVQYARDERFRGETKYSLSKMLSLSFLGITSFSNKPLLFPIWIGFIFGFLSLIFFIKIIIDWNKGFNIQGWTSIMAIILLIGSLNFIILGLIGEYLSRIFSETKNRPRYLIDEFKKNKTK